MAEATLKVKQLQVRQLEAELDRLRGRLAALKLVAPFAGVIASLDVQVGDKVEPYQPFGVLADPSQLQIEATVPEEDLAWVKPGQDAQVIVDGFADQTLKAKVAQVGSKSTQLRGQRTYPVRLELVDGARVPAAIRMGADVQFAVTKSQVLTLPTSAVLKDSDGYYVEVPAGNGTRRVGVGIGLAGQTEYEIASGLGEGDAVVVRQGG